MERTYCYNAVTVWPRGMRRFAVSGIDLAWRLGLSKQQGAVRVSTEAKEGFKEVKLLSSIYKDSLNTVSQGSSSFLHSWCKVGLRKCGIRAVPRSLWYKELP